MFVPTTQNAADVQALADMLASTPIGAVVTYSDLSDAIGRDVLRVRHLLHAARIRARKDTGAVFSPVTRVGLRRLTAEEAHTIGSTARQRVRRTSKRALVAMAAVLARANDLPPDVMRRATAEISALGLLEHLAADRNQPPPPEEPKAEPVAVVARRFLARISGERAG